MLLEKFLLYCNCFSSLNDRIVRLLFQVFTCLDEPLKSTGEPLVVWPHARWQMLGGRSSWDWMPLKGHRGKVVHKWVPFHPRREQRSHAGTIYLVGKLSSPRLVFCDQTLLSKLHFLHISKRQKSWDLRLSIVRVCACGMSVSMPCVCVCVCLNLHNLNSRTSESFCVGTVRKTIIKMKCVAVFGPILFRKHCGGERGGDRDGFFLKMQKSVLVAYSDHHHDGLWRRSCLEPQWYSLLEARRLCVRMLGSLKTQITSEVVYKKLNH